MEYIYHNHSEEIISNGKMITTMLSLKPFEYSLLLNKGKNPIINIDLRFTDQSGKRMDYGIRVLKRNEVLNTEIWTPILNFRNISVHGTLMPLRSDQYRFDGVLYRDMITYNLNGVVYFDDIYLKKVRLQAYPLSGKPNGLIEFDFMKNNDTESDFDFYFNAMENGEYCKLSGGYSYNNLTGVDLSILLQSTVSAIGRIHGIGSYHLTKDDSIIAKLTLETPWRYKTINIWSQIYRRPDQGKIHGGYKFDSHTAYGNCEWSWKPEQNMRILIESSIDRPDGNSSFVFTELNYVNPNITFQDLHIGGKLNISSVFNFEVNASLNYESIDNVQVGIITYWPLRKHEIHEIKGRYCGNLISKQDTNLEVFVEGKYSEKLSNRWCLARFVYTNLTNIRSMGLVEWHLTDKTSTFQADVEMSMVAKARREFLAKFITPKFGNQATLLLTGSYDRINGNHRHFNWSIHYPSTTRIADMDLSIQSFSNLNAVLNCTTPFLEWPWIKADLNFTTHGLATYRLCRIEWSKDFSFIKLHSTKRRGKFNNLLEGNITLEVPLNTRHRGCIKYTLNETKKLDKGSIHVSYNEKLVVHGTYQREVQNYDVLKETTDIIIDNIFKPIGIHFVNSSDMRDIDKIFSVRHIELFDLHNSKFINLTCELYVTTSEAEKEVKLVAIHPNRTVIVTTSLKTPNPQTINHRGKLELSKTAWIEYNLVIGNNNTDNNEIRNFVANLTYPKRSISMNGFYLTTSNAFNSNVSFEWSEGDNDNTRAVWTSILCQTEALGPEDNDNKTIMLVLGHRLLERDIKLKGSFYRGIKELFKVNVLIVYSYEMDHLIVINAVLKDLRDGLDLEKYGLEFLTYHKASELDVQLNGSATARTSYFKIQTKSLYKRDYFPAKHGLFLILLDSHNKEIEYMRKSPYGTLRIWMQPNFNYPVYGVNATLWNTPAVNNSGYIYIDMLQKEAHMYFNLTEDGSHNLLMFGCIPDSRKNYIKVWRNYDEISVVDVSSYIKLNHSRHLSGGLHWRPKIKSELKEKIISTKEALLNAFTEQIDFWTTTLHIETFSAITVVWETAKEYNKDFINDISQLSVLKEDLEDFRTFMNKSYEANDFYIKTFVNFTYTMLDEIALRDQVDSLPIIFKEIGQFLGESVKVLSRSIVQMIEMIKRTYNKIVQGINNFFHGQSLKYLTDVMEKGFKKYEKFVKELHISFIHHIEIFWSKFSNAISTYFKGVLKRIEPHVFESMSFIEKTIWDLSKKVFNFIYERTNELAESTYFNQISSFTQDIENLYKDIKSHDFILNTKKYASVAWSFLKEKYYKVIPFGSELNEVIHEIWHEIKELGKIKQLKVLIKKFNHVVSEMEWMAKELKFRKHLQQIYALIRNKMRNYALNALEIASIYREAKTKFVFDPEKGVIDFEQKLPVSWYAFNETPKFQEIPEYQLIKQVQNILSANDTSFIKHIYDFRSYLDPKTWLLSHYSRAFLIDSGFYITFDKRLVTLNVDPEEVTNCTYLLSHEFWNNSFSLFVDFLSTSGNKVVSGTKYTLIAKEHSFEICFKPDALIIDGILNPWLPAKLDNILVQRDSNMLLIHSVDGYKLECNMRFDMCWFEVSGKYFGRTAGILGTMNNEPFDDFITPSNSIAKSNDIFTDAWNSNICNKKRAKKASTVKFTGPFEICQQLFSSFTHCANLVDPEHFITICMELGNKSNKGNSGHSSLKGYCTAAVAYIEVCRLAKIPMRVPQQCILSSAISHSHEHSNALLDMKPKQGRKRIKSK
ncbi:uncharacterized protein LOC118735030 [Rhagoletis pomonella]|uniref:uncharacterized protein LOC118735030 n=1 Tax=Rhagoletis pomonella TaxID=28610 RepID=UPI00177C2680|nr:uncharacterized protein LOC118735030 [Rhagoletis pomonella]